MRFTNEEETSFSIDVFFLKSGVMKIRSLPSTLFLLSIGIFLGASSLRAQSISVSASPTVITNAGDQSAITFTVSPPSPVTLSVRFVLTGTASYGSDYVMTGDFTRLGEFIIPAGHSTATMTLYSFYDDDRPGTFESVFVTVLKGKRYRVGSPSRTQVTIENID